MENLWVWATGSGFVQKPIQGKDAFDGVQGLGFSIQGLRYGLRLSLSGVCSGLECPSTERLRSAS